VLRRAVFALVVGVLAVALALAPSALAALIHVRVEGKTTTIFGPTEPQAVSATALDALEAASRAGEFYYDVKSTSFGPYVDQIGRFPGAGSTGWVFKVNGASPPVGADQVQLKDGDTVLWYYADFSSGSGPKTLELKAAKRGCYSVLAYDDAGKATPAAGAVLVNGGRTFQTKEGSACPPPHRGLVRATLAGAVRSNALP